MKMLRTLYIFAFGALVLPVAAFAQSYSGGGFDALRGGGSNNICRGEALALYQEYTEIQQIIERIADCNRNGQVYREGVGCDDPTLTPDHVFTPSDTGATLAFYNADGSLGTPAVVGGVKGDDVACVEVEDPDDPTHCEAPWGSTIVNGSTVTAYQESSVPYGESCASQGRTCTNGTLSGSYTFASCSVDDEEVAPPPPPPTEANCTAPWGATVAHGSSVTAYRYAQAPSGQTCSGTRQTRTCNDGTLSGSYSNQACYCMAGVWTPLGGSVGVGSCSGTPTHSSELPTMGTACSPIGAGGWASNGSGLCQPYGCVAMPRSC